MMMILISKVCLYRGYIFVSAFWCLAYLLILDFGFPNLYAVIGILLALLLQFDGSGFSFMRAADCFIEHGRKMFADFLVVFFSVEHFVGVILDVVLLGSLWSSVSLRLYADFVS